MLPTCERVLRHQDADHDDVCRTCALAPAWPINACAVDERLEDEVPSLVRRRGSEERNDERDCPNRMPPYRDIVQVPQQVHAEGVDESLGDENCGVDAYSSFCGRHESGVERLER